MCIRDRATIKLDVYATKNSTAATPPTLTNGEDAYPYAVGDYVLLNAVNRSGLGNDLAVLVSAGLVGTGVLIDIVVDVEVARGRGAVAVSYTHLDVYKRQALGAATVFFFARKVCERAQGALLGFAAGVMMAASVWSLILPAIRCV